VRSTAPWRAVAASLVAAVAGCSSPPATVVDAGGQDATAGEPVSGEPMTVDGSQCNAVIADHADEGANHIACTTPATYLTMPPSSGNHYPIWPAPGTYTAAIPWGHLVHFMEHGGVVIVYNCGATGCADELARAQAFVAGIADAACTPARVIMMPDPTLDVRWAASAWTWTLRADCYDDAAFSQFVAEHLGHGLEAVCGGAAIANLCPPP
jgi:hypothetical protein